MGSGFKVLDSFSVSGTWILDSYRSGIPDSLKCIPDSKAQKTGIYGQTFLLYMERCLVLLDFPYFLVFRFQAKQTQRLSRLVKQQWKRLRR